MEKVISFLLLVFSSFAFANTVPVIERCDEIVFKAYTEDNHRIIVCRLKSGGYSYQQQSEKNNNTFFTNKEKVVSQRITNKSIYAAEMSLEDEDRVRYTITVWSREDKHPEGQVEISHNGQLLESMKLKSSTITSKICKEKPHESDRSLDDPTYRIAASVCQSSVL